MYLKMAEHELISSLFTAIFLGQMGIILKTKQQIKWKTSLTSGTFIWMIIIDLKIDVTVWNEIEITVHNICSTSQMLKLFGFDT